MAKKRALSIKAIVTQNSVDSDGKTVNINRGIYYFPIESFVYDYIKGVNMAYRSRTTPEGFGYLSFNSDPSEMLDSLDTIFNRPETLEDKTLSYKATDRTQITTYKKHKELFDGLYIPPGGLLDTVGGDLSTGTEHDFAGFVRFEFLSLSDEAYNKFLEVWKDKITKTLNSIFPELVGEITLVFTNSATTEE